MRAHDADGSLSAFGPARPGKCAPWRAPSQFRRRRANPPGAQPTGPQYQGPLPQAPQAQSTATARAPHITSSNEIVRCRPPLFFRARFSRELRADRREGRAANSGSPNGYVLGQEGGGAVVAGAAATGEGILYKPRIAGDLRVFWQGPSLGYDFRRRRRRAHDDACLQSCPSPDAIYQRFPRPSRVRLTLVGGLGMTALTMNEQSSWSRIRTGVGDTAGARIVG